MKKADFDSSADESEEDRDFNDSNASNSNSESEINSSDSESENSESDAEFTDSDNEQTKRKRSKNVKSSTAKKVAKNSDKKVKTSAKPKSKSEKEQKEPRRSRFLDMEAEVGDEDEDEEDEEDAEFLARDGFIVGSDEEEEANAAAAELDSEIRPRHPTFQDTEFDAEAEERRLKALYGRARDAHARSTAALTSQNLLPKPFLLPTVTDPKLWLCKAQQGRERSSALALLRCVMERQFSGNPLPIFSIIARDGLKGYVYIEAHKPTHVFQAIDTAKLGHCLYPGQGGKSLVLVPLAEMPQVLQTTAASSSSSGASTAELPEIGSWVRVKRGRYANDLAQVVDNAQDEGSFDPSNLNTCIVRVKMLPRLGLSANSSSKSATERVPPKAFDPEEASRHGPVSKSRGFWIYGGETYRDGFLFKNLRLSSLQCDSVNPSLEELARFPESDSDSSVPQNDFSQAQTPTAASSALASFSIGDRVIVLDGEMKNLPAVIDSLEWRPNPSTGRPEQLARVIADVSTGLQGESGTFTVKVSILRKTFQVGEQVRVLSGPHSNESGIVVSLDSKSHNLVIFSAINSQQFTVSPSFCVKAEGSNDSSEQNTKKLSAPSKNDEYSLDDLVQFNVNGEDGVGVIIRILDTENSVAVYDLLGQVRTAPCRTLRLLATAPSQNSRDYQQSDDKNLKQNDRVSDVTGSFFKIIHIYKSLAFSRPLGNSGLGGSVSCCVHPLEKLSRPRAAAVPSFSPASASSGSGFAGRGLLGKSVTITAGPQKGYVGFVKQITDNLARVELHTNGKVINVPVDKLSIPEKEAARISASTPSSRNPGARHSHSQHQQQHPSASSAYTPAWNATPSGSKTPSWNAAGPSGGKTPSWNASSSKTPAWNSSSNSSMTPSHPQSASSSSKTPAWSTSTGMTPAWNVPTAVGQSSTAAGWKSGTTPAWGSNAKTPAWTQSEPNNDSTTTSTSADQKKKPWDQVNNINRD